jgi:hypothetical protein
MGCTSVPIITSLSGGGWKEGTKHHIHAVLGMCASEKRMRTYHGTGSTYIRCTLQVQERDLREHQLVVHQCIHSCCQKPSAYQKRCSLASRTLQGSKELVGP